MDPAGGAKTIGERLCFIGYLFYLCLREDNTFSKHDFKRHHEVTRYQALQCAFSVHTYLSTCVEGCSTRINTTIGTHAWKGMDILKQVVV